MGRASHREDELRRGRVEGVPTARKSGCNVGEGQTALASPYRDRQQPRAARFNFRKARCRVGRRTRRRRGRRGRSPSEKGPRCRDRAWRRTLDRLTRAWKHSRPGVCAYTPKMDPVGRLSKGTGERSQSGAADRRWTWRRMSLLAACWQAAAACLGLGRKSRFPGVEAAWWYTRRVSLSSIPMLGLVSRLEEPSSGSKPTSYLDGVSPRMHDLSSSDAIAATRPVRCDTKMSLAMTSIGFCLSPCTLSARPAAGDSNCGMRKSSEICSHAAAIEQSTPASSGSAPLAASASGSKAACKGSSPPAASCDVTRRPDCRRALRSGGRNASVQIARV